ncbi:MAG: DUF6067 family protein [Dysgonamonadaceae bacterium]|nr:DUF6067 family protein [Dysgonamonadaceae bacterium]
MKNIFTGIISFCLFIFIFQSIACSQVKNIDEYSSITERADPTADTLSDWSKVPSGLNISFADIDTRYPRSVAPDIPSSKILQLSGWKGERISGQLLLWSVEKFEEVNIEFESFQSSSSSLPTNIAQARFVRYVITDYFERGCEEANPDDFRSSLSPDILDNIKYFDIEPKNVRPVWITIDIPREAEAGLYKGKINIESKNKNLQKLDIAIEVKKKTLPLPADWKFHLDMWQHPTSVARVNGLEVWSDEHFEKMKPIMKLLVDAGQKVITATLNKEPWNNQCYDAYADMITWTKTTDGSWKYDYTAFDKWVHFMQDLGIKGTIDCYSMLPWGNELHYHDASTGKMVNVNAKPGSTEFYEMWTPFLQDFVIHLKQKGWINITNIAMDERTPEDLKAVVDLMQKAAPELGISLADNHQSYKKYPFVRSLTLGFNSPFTKEDLDVRRDNGLVSAYYVCCGDRFPNIFTFSNPADAVYISWYSLALGYDGFLHWTYNSWNEKPLEDSRFIRYPAGDTYIVYPDRSSVRFERLREGIQDAEKIRIYRDEWKEKNDLESKEKLEKMNKIILQFGSKKESPELYQELKQAKKLLNDWAE